MGGFMKPGEWSWVGERGPELIRAGSQGATVVPNAGHTINFIFQGNMHASEFMSRDTQAQISKKLRGALLKPQLTG